MIVITGATGLVGNFLLKQLVNQKDRVKVIIRKESDKHEFEYDTTYVEWVVGDINDVQFLYDVIPDVKEIYHCAGLVSYSSKNEDLLDRVNVDGTRNLVNVSMELGIDKFCFISSIAALGSSKDKVINESAPFDPNNYNSYYAKSKYLAELEVWRASEEGLNVIIVNPTIILGPGDWNRSSSKIFKYVYDENSYYMGGGYNFIDVRDVTELCVTMMKSDISGEQFVLSGKNVSYKYLFELVAKGFDKLAPRKKAGKGVKRLLYYYSKLKNIFSNAEPIITKDAINKSDKFPEIDNSKVQNQFPHEYFSIEKTVEWSCKELLNKRA